jgi:RNA 2',3'-cyclic 3'-phosphodiesterase
LNVLRLFFALQPAAEQGAELFAQAAEWVERLQGRAVPADNFHATLCFVGAVEESRLDSLRAAAASVRGRALALSFSQYEFWEKPGVLCATVARESVEAQALASALTAAAIAAGFAPDAKTLRAHITLARKVSATVAFGVEWPVPFAPAMTMRCDRFVLMQSRREGETSIYSAVDSWPLYADESQ